MADLIKSCS